MNYDLIQIEVKKMAGSFSLEELKANILDAYSFMIEEEQETSNP